MDFVEENCDYYLSDECYGSLSGKCINENVNGGRLKRESKTAVIYQFPYEFIYPNTGLCWVQEGITCDYFGKIIVKDEIDCSAVNEERTEIYSSTKKQESRFCECGAGLAKRRRYCDSCRKKREQKTNRENQRNHRARCNTVN